MDIKLDDDNRGGRFVVLWHEVGETSGRTDHFDLMLEMSGGLMTWELLEWPVEPTNCRAKRLPDHRTDYLDYQGEISGERGIVCRKLGGRYRMVQQSSVGKTYQLFDFDFNDLVGESIFHFQLEIGNCQVGEFSSIRFDYGS